MLKYFAECKTKYIGFKHLTSWQHRDVMDHASFPTTCSVELISGVVRDCQASDTSISFSIHTCLQGWNGMIPTMGPYYFKKLFGNYFCFFVTAYAAHVTYPNPQCFGHYLSHFSISSNKRIPSKNVFHDLKKVDWWFPCCFHIVGSQETGSNTQVTLLTLRFLSFTASSVLRMAYKPVNHGIETFF